MGPTWVLSALDGPHVGPMNLAIKVDYETHKAGFVRKDGPFVSVIIQCITNKTMGFFHWIMMDEHALRTVCLDSIKPINQIHTVGWLRALTPTPNLPCRPKIPKMYADPVLSKHIHISKSRGFHRVQSTYCQYWLRQWISVDQDLTKRVALDTT